MASSRRRWRYRHPSWLQIGWLYLLAIIFTIGPTPHRVGYALVFALFVTILVVLKVLSKSVRQTDADGQ